jgi:hypothetical protein
MFGVARSNHAIDIGAAFLDQAFHHDVAAPVNGHVHGSPAV